VCPCSTGGGPLVRAEVRPPCTPGPNADRYGERLRQPTDVAALGWLKIALIVTAKSSESPQPGPRPEVVNITNSGRSAAVTRPSQFASPRTMGVAVTLAVGVTLGVGVGVPVGLEVCVGVAVGDGVRVVVAVLVGVSDAVAVSVGVSVGDAVAVRVAVGVGVEVRVGVRVGGSVQTAVGSCRC
jgi:hypothetical protein